MPNETQKRIKFTRKMKREYTILIPTMLPIHFEFIKNVFIDCGYKVVLLHNTSPKIVQTGLKYVQNDTCFPALLVIGQMIDALNSGMYDVDKTALMIMQTGGGCRASNYIHLLRKGLKKAGYANVPVVSLNFAGLEFNSGFIMTLSLMRKLLASVIYGDCLMTLKNQIKPYEKEKGETESLVRRWIDILTEQFRHHKGLSARWVKSNLEKICSEFEKIPRQKERNKTKVGIVGEIYIKYSALGNNHLEDFLVDSENCEICVPGLLGFVQYCCDNPITGSSLYGDAKMVAFFAKQGMKYLLKIENLLIEAIDSYTTLSSPKRFYENKEKVRDIIGYGAKMGEGWLLTAEMVELIREGINNIICAQPFGCLPNHIVGKGMIRKLRSVYPEANVVPIDYDSSASKVNQENRIKLMLCVAREHEESLS